MFSQHSQFFPTDQSMDHQSWRAHGMFPHLSGPGDGHNYPVPEFLDRPSQVIY